MDLYDFKNMGHSGFENVRIVDTKGYENGADEEAYVLFEGDLDDAHEALDYLEITSIDVYVGEDGNIIATIDVDGASEETYAELEKPYPFAE